MKRKVYIVLMMIPVFFLCSCRVKEPEYSSDIFYEKVAGDVFESFESVKQVLDVAPDYEFNAPYYTDSICYTTESFVGTSEEQAGTKAEALYNVTDSEIIYASNIFSKVYPASITKLMTALLVLENCDLDEEITIEDNGISTLLAGSKNCEFLVGERLTVRTLLYSLLVYSGNDAAYILANHVAGSEKAFVDMMNAKAVDILANDTHFVNSHGLNNPDHYTTPYDMYLVFNECLKSEVFRDAINTVLYSAVVKDKDGNDKTYSFEQTNFFKLGLAPVPAGIEVIGGKTGTTPAAGYCMIMFFKDADGNEYICESFGNKTAEDLYNSLTRLMEMV